MISDVSKQKLNNIFFSKFNIYESINNKNLITNELYKCILSNPDGNIYIKYYVNEKQIPEDTMIDLIEWQIGKIIKKNNLKNYNHVEIEIIESKIIENMDEFNKFILDNFIKDGRLFKIIN